jgi:hypothetical protein
MFVQPFNMQICGPTQSGKSTFIKHLVDHADKLIEPPPSKIVYIKHEQSGTPEFKRPVAISSTLDTLDDSHPANTLFILDDLFCEAGNDQRICNFFTRTGHHMSCSCILSTQNMFSYRECKYATTLNRNCKYLVSMKAPRDRSSIRSLAMQMNPGKWRDVVEAYNMATSTPHGYLAVDLSQDCNEHERLKTNIFNEDGQYPVVFKVD